jgi:hypothetical protein
MMGKTVAVLQSNYIPWKGYFDIIHDVDLFIFYDDLQYTKGDWRNRNLLKSPQGTEWLTIPVGAHLDRLICDVELTDRKWTIKHWRTIQQLYGKAPCFQRYQEFFADVYLKSSWLRLSQLNQFLIQHIAREFLGLKTEFRDSREYAAQGQKQDRLLDLLQKAGATTYVSGPAAKNYIEPSRFEELGVGLVWKDYSGYPEYPQSFPPFEHGVSVLDLLFQVGSTAAWYIWGWRQPGSTPLSEVHP